MQFQRITSVNDPALTFIKTLYEDAFPPHERRDWVSLLGLVPDTEEMHLDLVYAAEQYIGLITWWEIEGCCFIEHFAIDAALRGQNYGARVLNHYKEQIPGTIILEVEHPEDSFAVRRIAFYERLGYHILTLPYRQPSYADPKQSFPFLLMSNRILSDQEASPLVEKIKSKVYLRSLS
ncbi:GNAT family N-acetyltransferase [Pedobacter caeni]|uniref:Acetyltransferase (GNAT) domain-containing protein n=1 Tax=Pedobacter caeni TaxID=288992 RepID=A0A1M5H9B5_9SPHI|nr:GNAT family N-acetyltransferase [Pedobacter caeni]SHG12513.1 Acetyltransferase (GNAT) domain-containing protein [Pedobacter caeni]